jgi:hypothetical protein
LAWKNLAGSATSQAILAGSVQLSALVDLLGQIVTTSASAGLARVQWALAGASSTASSLSSSISRALEIVGSAVTESVLGGFMSCWRLLAGISLMSSALFGSLNKLVELAGNAITSSMLAGSAAVRRALAGMVKTRSTLIGHLSRAVSLRSSVVTGSELVADLMERGHVILIGTVRGLSSSAGRARVSWALSGSISSRMEVGGLARLFNFIIRSGRSAVSRSQAAQSIIMKVKAGASGIAKSVRGDSEF